MNWLRISYRLPAFVLITLVLGLLRVVPRAVPGFRGELDRSWRVRLFGLWARLMRRVIGMRVDIEGPLPGPSSFVVTNHVSYVDVLLLANVLPARFVAKSEVAQWPFLGKAAQAAGTLFVNRQAKRHVVAINHRILTALSHGDAVVLFPEGTSSDGQTVLPFKPSLLHVPASESLPVFYAAIRYRTSQADADARQHVCWWGDMKFFPHFVALLGLPGFEATLRFGDKPLTDPNRKQLSLRLHESIKSELAGV